MTGSFAARLFDPAGVWPWAETNQGLLSIVALVAALSVAVWEIRQSARRDVRALVEYIDWVLNCADQSIAITDAAIRRQTSEGDTEDGLPFAVWQVLNGNGLAALQEITALRPTHPKLNHHVNRLIRAMGKAVQDSPYATYIREVLEHFKTYVVLERDNVAGLRPMTLGDRLGRAASRIAGRWRKPTTVPDLDRMDVLT